MATSTLKKAFSKVSEAMNGNQEENQPVLYFTDHQALKRWDIEQGPIIEEGNRFINCYKHVTGFEIKTMTDLAFAENDPEGFYKQQFYESNEMEFASLTKLKLNFDSMIEVPEGFNDVIQARNKFKSRIGGKRREHYNIENGEFVFTEAAYERRNRAVYLYATTREEKGRLNLANNLITALNALSAAVPAKYTEAIRNKKFAHPLPYQVRIVQGDNGPELSPSPKWILEGWGGTATLGVYIPTHAERKDATTQFTPKIGEKYKKVRIVDVNGVATDDHVLCKEEELHKHVMGPFRIHRNIVLNGYYNEQGKPYGEPLKTDNIPSPTSWSDKMMKNLKV